MLRSLLLLFAMSLFYNLGLTQSLQEWQEAHPEILLVNELDATDDFIQVLDKKGIKYIIYSGELNLDEIKPSQSENEKSSTYSINDSEGDAIKIWLASNPDVKILTRSYFESLSEPKKEIYLTNYALVLLTDELTYQDIQNYNNRFENTLTH